MGIACDSHISFRVCMLGERAAFRKREEKEEEKVCVMWEIACSVRSPKKEEEELGEEILPSPVSQLGKNGDSYSLVRMIRGKIRNKVVNQFSPENARKKSQ